MTEMRPNRNRHTTDKPQPRPAARMAKGFVRGPMLPEWFAGRERALLVILEGAASICNSLREQGAQVNAGLELTGDGAFAPSVSVKAPGGKSG